jgi:6-phosphogluconolactonase (cycloisomerase 2 family)
MYPTGYTVSNAFGACNLIDASRLACHTEHLKEGTRIKTLLRSFGLIFFASLMGFAQSPKTAGPELLYGAPADARLNTFPVMTIDRATGGFTNFFNVTAPPPFLCSGGEVAVGSRFLYVSLPPNCQNQQGEIIGYSLDQTTGVPSSIPGSPFPLKPGASPNGMVALPARDIIYIADAAGTIDAFTVNKKSGVPKRIKGSPFKAGTSYELVVDPSGKFLYASDYDPPGGVFAFVIGGGGVLTRVPGSPFKVAGPKGSNYQPVGIVDTGRYVYIALSNTNQIAAFSIESKTGALKPVKGSPFPTGNAPAFLALSGKFLYVADELDGNIAGYSINEKSGVLTTISGSPFGSDAVSLIVDSTGNYLYVSGPRGIQGYDIDHKTGALTTGKGSHGNDGSLWLTVVDLP